MPLSAVLTAVPHPGLVGAALFAARGGDPLVIATPASFPLRVATQGLLPWADNPDPADPSAPPISVSLPISCWQLLAGQISLWDSSVQAQIICGHTYTEATLNALMDCAIDVGGLNLVLPYPSLQSIVAACYQAGRECRRDARVLLCAASFAAVSPPANMAAIPVRARWLWYTPARSFLDRDMCSAPLVVLLYFLAPYCLETGRDEQNTNFSMMWADLLSATTSRSELYLRRATPVGAPAAASNLHLVGRYVGETWLILYQAAYFTFSKGNAFSEIDTAFKIAFGSESDRRTAYVHSIFTAQLCSSIHLKRLVLDEGNPWATSQQFSLYEQISSTVNVGDTDLCSTVSFDLLEKSLSANCADFINSLSQGCAAARVLAFKKEFSSTKTNSAAVHITGGSVTDGGSDVSVAGGGASAKKASRRKDFIDTADKITAHKRQLDDPGAGDPDVMDAFQDFFQSSSKLMHGIALGVSTGLAHEVIAHSSVFSRRLPEYLGQSTCMSRDGVIHDRLQGEHWLSDEMGFLKAGTFDLIDWYRIRNRHDQATKNAIPSLLSPDNWYKDFAMLTDTGSLVQKLLISLGVDGVGELSFPSAWDRLLEFERNGRSYMPGTILHTDHYNTVQRLAAMLLREAGNRIMQQFSQPVDWEVIPYKFPLSERSHFWNEISFYEKEEEKLQNSKMSHPGLAAVLAGGGGGDARLPLQRHECFTHTTICDPHFTGSLWCDPHCIGLPCLPCVSHFS